MFMIDGIELCMFKESHQMREFKCDRAVGFKCCFKPLGEIIDIRYVSIYIVAHN